MQEYQKLLEEIEELEELEAIQAYDNAILSDEEDIPFEVAISEIENSRQWIIRLLEKRDRLLKKESFQKRSPQNSQTSTPSMIIKR